MLLDQKADGQGAEALWPGSTEIRLCQNGAGYAQRTLMRERGAYLYMPGPGSSDLGRKTPANGRQASGCAPLQASLALLAQAEGVEAKVSGHGTVQVRW